MRRTGESRAVSSRGARFRRGSALLVVLVLVLAACSGDDSGGSAADFAGDDSVDDAADFAGDDSVDDAGGAIDGGAGDDATAREDTEGAADASDVGDDRGPGLATPTALTPADIGRDIVFRATISVEVDDVAAAGREAQQVIDGLGGLVFGQQTRTEPEPVTVLVFKVLPEDFGIALERLAGVGRLVDQTISADDVTERVVDLQSRINTAEASVQRLRALLGEAGDLAVIAQLEDQLLDRETTLETLRGQLRTLRDQVDLATITLTLVPSPTVVAPTGIEVASWLSEGGDDPCLGRVDLEVGENATVNMCYEIENVGESVLTELEVDVGAVRHRLETLTVTSGDPTRLEPGDRLVLTVSEKLRDGRIAGRPVNRGLEIRTEVRATPIDDEGRPLAEVGDESFNSLVITTDDALPGFLDGLDGTLSTLLVIGGVLLLLAGVLLPFAPVIAVVAWLLLRRRSRRIAPGPADPSAASPRDGEGRAGQAG